MRAIVTKIMNISGNPNTGIQWSLQQLRTRITNTFANLPLSMLIFVLCLSFCLSPLFSSSFFFHPSEISLHQYPHLYVTNSTTRKEVESQAQLKSLAEQMWLEKSGFVSSAVTITSGQEKDHSMWTWLPEIGLCTLYRWESGEVLWLEGLEITQQLSVIKSHLLPRPDQQVVISGILKAKWYLCLYHSLVFHSFTIEQVIFQALEWKGGLRVIYLFRSMKSHMFFH